MNQEKEDKEGIDLSGELKDSDTGAESQNRKRKPAQAFLPGTPKIVQWTIKYSCGLVKDEKQANYVLIGFVAVTVIISLFLIFGEGDRQETFAPQEKEYIPYP